MTPTDLVIASRVPRSVGPFKSRLYNGRRMTDHRGTQLFKSYYALCHVCMAGLHQVGDDGFGGYVVMEDTERELRRHLPIMLAARGRVLVSGLGLGCVVRGMLANGRIEHIDVVEINKDIIDHFGSEFSGDARVSIHHGDALSFDLGRGPWDYAWHDIYTDGNDGLAQEHAKLIARSDRYVGRQGAWQFPRIAHRMITARGQRQLLGAPRA